MVLTKKKNLVLIDDHGYQKIKYPVLTYNHGSQVLSFILAPLFHIPGSDGSLILIFGFPQIPGTASKSKFTFVSHT